MLSAREETLRLATDDELLAELRRRGVVRRAEASRILPPADVDVSVREALRQEIADFLAQEGPFTFDDVRPTPEAGPGWYELVASVEVVDLRVGPEEGSP